jgi:hypothetical protein
MGYAIVKGKYHKGPKKNTRKRVVRKPVLAQPTDLEPQKVIDLDTAIGVGTAIVKALSTERDARPVDTAPRGGFCGGFGGGFGGFGGLEGCDLSGLGRRRGGDCVDVPAPSKPTVPSKVVSEPSEKVIGQIVRKPNGEIVLRFF